MAKILSVSGYDRRLGPIFEPGTTLALRVRVGRSAEKPGNLFLTWALTGMFGQTSERKMELAGGCSETEVQVRVPLGVCCLPAGRSWWPQRLIPPSWSAVERSVVFIGRC